MRTKGLAVLIVVAVLGVAGTITAAAVRPADDAFLFSQRVPRTVHAQRLEGVLIRIDEPAPTHPTRAVKAHCRRGGHGPRGNPWSCRVRYRSGTAFTYRIRVARDGSFKGTDPTGERIVSGCCVID